MSNDDAHAKPNRPNQTDDAIIAKIVFTAIFMALIVLAIATDTIQTANAI